MDENTFWSLIEKVKITSKGDIALRPHVLKNHLLESDPAFIESFNGKVRQECLNQHWFLNLQDAKDKLESFREDYNHNRPHSSLAYQTP